MYLIEKHDERKEQTGIGSGKGLLAEGRAGRQREQGG